jgi:hypothetical protein
MATWGTLTWSTGNWGDQTNSTVSLTGIGASFNLGSVTTTSTVEFGWGRDLWSSRAWGSPSQEVLLGSFSITANLGDETTAGEINAGWGRLTWGENAWGEQGDVVLSGIAMSASLGDESTVVDVSPTLTGIPMTASQGDESIEISFEIIPSSIAMSANLGTVDAGPDAMLTGIGASASVGTLEAYNLEGWGRYFWGQFEWGATGEWEFVTPTGISMSANVGTLAATGTAELDLTGIQMTAEEGTVDPSPDATVTGIGFGMAVATGTVITGEANVTVVGEGFSATLGTGTLDAVTFADVTSISMSANLGSVTTVANANVFPTGIQLTMVVNSANALIWNEVNTGSAPLDPPGWQEVPTRAA